MIINAPVQTTETTTKITCFKKVLLNTLCLYNFKIILNPLGNILKEKTAHFWTVLLMNYHAASCEVSDKWFVPLASKQASRNLPGEIKKPLIQRGLDTILDNIKLIMAEAHGNRTHRGDFSSPPPVLKTGRPTSDRRASICDCLYYSHAIPPRKIAAVYKLKKSLSR